MANPNDGALKIEGLRELQRVLRKLPDDLVDELKDLHLTAAEPVKREVKMRVPVRSGRLQRTVRSSGTKKSGVVRVGTKAVPYAGAINFGYPSHTVRPWGRGTPVPAPIPGQHFLERSLERRRAHVFRIMEVGLDRFFNRAFARLPK